MTSEGTPQPTTQADLHLASSSQRIPELDGLRGFAILLV
jgi:peptidoglycan/LPS O-acetylase OafA/YrhL